MCSVFVLTIFGKDPVSCGSALRAILHMRLCTLPVTSHLALKSNTRGKRWAIHWFLWLIYVVPAAKDIGLTDFAWKWLNNSSSGLTPRPGHLEVIDSWFTGRPIIDPPVLDACTCAYPRYVFCFPGVVFFTPPTLAPATLAVALLSSLKSSFPLQPPSANCCGSICSPLGFRPVAPHLRGRGFTMKLPTCLS